MAADYTKIVGGTVYDPANGIDGQVLDLWISAGKMAAPPGADVRPARSIDATGLVVMPGGIDMHCHIVGPKVNAARMMRPEEKRAAYVARTDRTRSGTLSSVPSSFITGYKYAGLGYTTAMDAAMTPLAARGAHEEFADTPCIDKGFFVLLGNNHYALQAIRQNEPQKLQALIAWLLGASKGFAPKLVNPGGVEMWKQHPAGNVRDIDQAIDHFQITPRQIIGEVARAAAALNLPHPVHIHCNNLGLPGNWTTTLETMKALNGHRGHLTHIQFHSYGGAAGEEDTFGSRTTELAEFVNAHPEITVDVGQVMFGQTTSLTGDGPLGYFLANLYGGKWFNCDVELESGCGVSPIEYKNKSLVHALQWAIGLEWYLQVRDPWQIAMSTDHPNGGSFMAYPEIIRLLMDRTYRNDILQTCPRRVRERSTLADLDRQYTLGEIAIITRAAPARMLGLSHKGHLGPGADADLTLYTPNENWAAMFELPRMVIKAGEVLVENGDLRRTPIGNTLYVVPQYDRDIDGDIASWFENHYSIRYQNYPVDLDLLDAPRQVPTN